MYESVSEDFCDNTLWVTWVSLFHLTMCATTLLMSVLRVLRVVFCNTRSLITCFRIVFLIINRRNISLDKFITKSKSLGLKWISLSNMFFASLLKFDISKMLCICCFVSWSESIRIIFICWFSNPFTVNSCNCIMFTFWYCDLFDKYVGCRNIRNCEKSIKFFGWIWFWLERCFSCVFDCGYRFKILLLCCEGAGTEEDLFLLAVTYPSLSGNT